jgi:two-component system, response regulator PdtaR
MMVMEKVVMVVEDESLIRMGVADYLIAQGLKVLEASDAVEALAILEEEAEGIQALFTDVWMPGVMDGLALSHYVKRHWPWIGLLVTSAHLTLEGAELPAGSRFLPKPYQYPCVMEAISELIG